MVAVLIGGTSLWYGGNPPEVSAALSLIVWWAVALGLTGGLLPRSPIARPALIAAGLFVLLTVLTAVSLFWSNNDGLAFYKGIQWFLLAGILILTLLTSVPGTARGWLGGITLGLGIIVLLGVIGRFFPGLSEDTELASTLYGASGRLSWPLGYWNAMGAAVALSIIGAVWFGAFHADRRWRTIGFGYLPISFLALYLTSSRGAITALLIGFGLLFWMESRRRRLAFSLLVGLAGGMVLVLVAAPMHDLVHAVDGGSAGTQGLILLACTILVVTGAIWARAHLEERARSLRIPRPTPVAWVVIGVLVVAAVVAANPAHQVRSFVATPKLSQATRDDNMTTYHLLSSNGNGRWQYWTAAVSGFETKPLLGMGAGSFRDYYDNHRETLLFGRHAHSLPLEVLSEQGLVGFLLAAGFLGVVIGITRRRWKTRSSEDGDGPFQYEYFAPLVALIATGLIAVSLDWSSEFPAISAPILIAMAVLVGPALLRRGAEPEPVPRAFDTRLPSFSFARLASALALIVCSGAVIFLSGIGFGSALYTEKSRDALGRGDYTAAVEAGQKAVSFAPWSSEAWIQLAAGQELAGDLTGALISLDDAVSHAPADSEPWFARFRIYHKLGENEAAMKALRRAGHLDPQAPFFQPIDVYAPDE